MQARFPDLTATGNKLTFINLLYKYQVHKKIQISTNTLYANAPGANWNSPVTHAQSHLSDCTGRTLKVKCQMTVRDKPLDPGCCLFAE